MTLSVQSWPLTSGLHFINGLFCPLLWRLCFRFSLWHRGQNPVKCLESSKSVGCVYAQLMFSECRCCEAARACRACRFGPRQQSWCSAGILKMKGHTHSSCQTGWLHPPQGEEHARHCRVRLCNNWLVVSSQQLQQQVCSHASFTVMYSNWTHLITNRKNRS